MDGINMENLNINEEEALNFNLEENDDERHDVNLCLVGRFIHDRPIKFNSMKTRMADVWRPVKSMIVKEVTQGLYLFKFFHPLDVKEVMKGGPWLFDNYTLVIDRMKVGVALHDIPLYQVNFWVQIHNVPVGMMLEKVGKGLANYIGEFVEYDKNNSMSFWRQYMRVKVKVDVRRPLKIEKNIMLNENKCEVKYNMEQDDGSRGWSNEIRAKVRRPGGRVESRWLREEPSSMGGVHTDCHASQREPQSSGAPQSNETQPRPRDNVATNPLSHRPILTLSNDKNTRQVGNAMAERGTTHISPIVNDVSQEASGSHLDDNDMEVQVERKRRRAEGLPRLMIILSWNCRGLGGPSAIPNLPVDVEGRSGGLAVLWKGSSNCSILNYTRNFINLLVEDEQRGEWRLTCYYGYPERSRRSSAWDLLRELGNMPSLPWCIIGYPFTWIKCRGTPHVIEERLDRAMTSTSWLNLFPNVHLSNLLASHLDHSPTLLHCTPSSRSRFNGSFRFENSLLREPDLEEVVLDGWGVHENIQVVDRVARCANRLQSWGRKKKVKFKEEIDECVREMEVLSGNNGEVGGRRYQEIHDRHVVLMVQEEDYWKQWAKMHWLKEGDMNTSFFHKSATARSKKKNVGKLVDEGGIEVHTQEELCERRVTAEDNIYLAAPITKDENHQALFQMHPDKSPGADGFNPAFYQRFWEQCGDDIFVAASNWLDRGYFPTSLNETNICLIPKCDNPISMKDLRPISLCKVLYQMISKVLANRLKICLDKCVSQEQSAFVEGRSILDNALIVIEVIHALKRKTEGFRALKIDISKAYDKVDWGFLRGVLTSMGFGDSWIRWIMMCVSSVNYSILMNYDKVGPIIPGRGLRQGDPLSPYLFILVAEGLTSLIHQAVGRGDGKCRRAKEDLASILGVRHALGTGIYLGLPSMIGRSKKAVFSYIKDRIWKKMNSWRGRALSKAGKEVMIKFVLQAIPSYVMSMFILPSSLIDDIEKMLNAFWWGGGSNNNKGIHWLAWDRLACPKAKGGLGFRNFEAFNMAMVAKQAWNIIQNPESLAAKLIKARYFSRSSLLEASLGYNHSFVWRSIWKARQILLHGCRWRIGSGDRIRVMYDPWLSGNGDRWVSSPQVECVYDFFVKDLLLENYKACNIAKIRNLFIGPVVEEIIATPLINSVKEDKEERNGYYSVKSGYNLAMRCIFRRPVVEEIIATPLINSVKEDKEERNGYYSVKSGYNLAMRCIFRSDRHHVKGNWIDIWKAQSPHKTRHLLWRLCRGCLPTQIRLAQRNVDCELSYPVCDDEVEDDIHVFFGCVTARECWMAAGLSQLLENPAYQDGTLQHFHSTRTVFRVFYTEGFS
ncbi:hypothetical protein TSUD_364090 [Trifolium subterraneum]|uniref:Reverse transcriptase domain-containing protein n=1 Tax=Trifolium subterraneum TaxID=3900 RepID=A0A2Z6N024_TRISU|nr:hypothetical protein TSUD_364090 [Trifolium subterraneum]